MIYWLLGRESKLFIHNKTSLLNDIFMTNWNKLTKDSETKIINVHGYIR